MFNLTIVVCQYPHKRFYVEIQGVVHDSSESRENFRFSIYNSFWPYPAPIRPNNRQRRGIGSGISDYLWRWREPIKQTSHLSISSREFEECLNKAGNHTWRKRRQNENRKPVTWNGIRLLSFDKCKFTKPFQRTKCSTRETTHWSYIYQI